MTTKRNPLNTWLKIATAVGLIIVAMATLHFTVNSDVGAWIRSIHR
ncbi:hypothetical protein [Martelella soudanensis]|nr:MULTISPECIES: hypothetical protein [unclassified Martelella]